MRYDMFGVFVTFTTQLFHFRSYVVFNKMCGAGNSKGYGRMLL
jgi:hypothetical protein